METFWYEVLVLEDFFVVDIGPLGCAFTFYHQIRWDIIFSLCNLFTVTVHEIHLSFIARAFGISQSKYV